MFIIKKESIRLLVIKSVYKKKKKLVYKNQLHFHAPEATSRQKCNSVNSHLKFIMPRNKSIVEDVSDFYG